MTRQRYSLEESINRILRLFQNKALPTDVPGTVSGDVLNTEEAFSDLAELFAGSLPNETAVLPSSISVGTSNIPANTYAAYVHTHPLAVAVKTSNYTGTSSDAVIVCNSTTAMTITLPLASASSQVIHIANINTGQVTVDGYSTNTINGEPTQLVDQWASMTVLDYLANKWVIL